MQRLPKEDYDTMVGAVIWTDFPRHRFTIPNFPSRLLAYMQAKLPVLAVTDPNTDIGKVISDGGFGWWCESNNSLGFKRCITKIKNEELDCYKEAAFKMLNNHFSTAVAYKTIISHLES